MNKRIFIKSIFITLILILAFSSICTVRAFDPDKYTIDPLTRKDAKTLFDMGDKLFGTLLNIATVVAILTIAIIGIKYMFGSVEQKAEYKASMQPWLIGAIIVFSITQIIQLFQAIAATI